MDLSKNKNIISNLEKSVSLCVYSISLFLCLSCGDLNKSSEISQKFVSDYELPSNEIDSSAYELKASDVGSKDFLIDKSLDINNNYDSLLVKVNNLIETARYEEAIQILLDISSDLLDKDEIVDKKQILRNINSRLGSCYRKMINPENGEEDIKEKTKLSSDYYKKAIEIAVSLGDKEKQIRNLNDISLFYRGLGDNIKFFEYLQKGLDVVNSGDINIINDGTERVLPVYLINVNLANYYVDNKDYISAKKFYIKAKEFVDINLPLAKDTIDVDLWKNSRVVIMSIESDFLINEKKYDEAIGLYEMAIVLTEETKNLGYQEWLLRAIEKIYRDVLGDYKLAYEYSQKKNAVNSKRITSEQQNAIARSQVEFESKELKLKNEKNQAELLAKEAIIVAAQERANRNLAISGGVTFLLLGAISAGFLLKRKNNLIIKQKAELVTKNEELNEKNNIITEKNAELGQAYEEVNATNNDLSEKNEIISEKNIELEQAYEELEATNNDLNQKNEIISEQKSKLEEALESINADVKYAVNIQNRYLYNASFVEDFPNPFVYWKPKKDVGGDFYLSGNILDNKKFLIVGDCTGKSVPGGFLTVATAFIIKNSFPNIKEPADIITFLDDDFQKFNNVKKDPEKNLINDALELACLFYDPETHIIDYSISNQSFYVIRDGEVLEHPYISKSDIKQKHKHTATIGSDRRSTDFEGYKTYSRQLLSGDSVFLFSDGMKDQFGGGGKNFRKIKFIRLLKILAELPDDQKTEVIQKTYNAWRKSENGEMVEQTDDMILVGFTVD